MTTMRSPTSQIPKATTSPLSHHDGTKTRGHGKETDDMLAEMSRDSENREDALELGNSAIPTTTLMACVALPALRLTNRHNIVSLLKTAFLFATCFWTRPVAAVLIPFSNCLNYNYIHPNQGQDLQLQWVPLFVDAFFDTEGPAHNLRVTVWGNVTGRIGNEELPPRDDPRWSDPDGVLWGKIRDLPEPWQPDELRKATTLRTTVDVLTYEPHQSYRNFCQNILNGSCPLGPVFNSTPYDSPYDQPPLPSFNVSHDFSSSYSLSSFAPTFMILHGDQASTEIGCVSATVTPSLGGVAWSLKFLPLFVLISVGVATAVAAVFSPWGTNDVFFWTSNYGRDPDLLRLVTPGFGDCLQYIQFVVLTGGLTLEYPGFFQPVVSQASWSVLMFNQSFVSRSAPWQSLVDGVYVTNGTYGLERIAQLDGMGQVEDIWAGMMIWLLGIIAAGLVLPQVGFFGRWIFRRINNAPEEDRRAKNIPFSIGNVVRVVFNYFLLPIVALSTFQLVVAGRSRGVLVGMAVLTLVVIIGFAVWLMYLIATTKPRAHLFDDLPTVLMYGPLYNTFSDEAAAFALIPIILTIMRGMAIGAVQPAGIAQIVILAACEVVLILTLHAFRPFHSPTSMNAYHTGFSVLRFVSLILMVTFSSNMGVAEGSKSWIGYIVLVIHGCVLVFGFFLNALQTIIEVIARLAGAGGDDVRGQTRGGLSKIFGARQLSRRVVDRRGAQSRQSQLSTAAMLDNTSKGGYGRVRSGSAGSMGIIMNQRNSSMLDARSLDAYSLPLENFTPTTPGHSSVFSLPSPGQATRPQAAADPYYRPPRARRANEQGPGTPKQDRGSLGSIDMRRMSQARPHTADGVYDPPVSGRVTPALASYAPVFAPRADYSTREVDFYYGVRGPALKSDGYGRKLGTGPADPTSPVATARGWLRGLFGGKTKDKGKGFEVVRSARMPPAMRARGGEFSDESPPEGIPVAMGVLRNGPIESDDEDAAPKIKRSRSDTAESAGRDLLNGDGEPREVEEDDEADIEIPKVPKDPPLLPDLDAGESFKVPSRVHSKASRRPSQRTAKLAEPAELVPEVVPEVPRKSSKRNSHCDRLSGADFNIKPPSEPSGPATHLTVDTQQGPGSTARLPFDRTNSQKRLSAASSAEQEDFRNPPSTGEERPTSFGYVHPHNISRVDPEQGVDLLGSTAELIDDPRRPSPSSSVSGRSR
ncbi:hypothetical protein DL767_002226 [Monosporascus sp. MG133]|nr:hypothetical protein DL767_002226 [Monosporascus sp. MG133]